MNMEFIKGLLLVIGISAAIGVVFCFVLPVVVIVSMLGSIKGNP